MVHGETDEPEPDTDPEPEWWRDRTNEYIGNQLDLIRRNIETFLRAMRVMDQLDEVLTRRVLSEAAWRALSGVRVRLAALLKLPKHGKLQITKLIELLDAIEQMMHDECHAPPRSARW